jgi:hypothetical protein
VAPGGRAILGWRIGDGRAQAVQARVLGTTTPPLTVGPGFTATTAAGANGSGVVTADGFGGVAAAYLRPNGIFESPVSLGPGSNPAPAVDGRGNVVVAIRSSRGVVVATGRP